MVSSTEMVRLPHLEEAAEFGEGSNMDPKPRLYCLVKHQLDVHVSRIRKQHGGRVDREDHSPRPLTDPDMRD
jgi:hypothetical protein